MFCQQPAASSKYKRREWEEISNYNRASDVRCGIVWREKYTRVRLLDAFLAMHWMFVCGSLFSSSLSIALHFITHNGQHFDTTSYHFVCKATTVRWCILWILAYNMDFFSALLSGAILWVFFRVSFEHACNGPKSIYASNTILGMVSLCMVGACRWNKMNLSTFL